MVRHIADFSFFHFLIYITAFEQQQSVLKFVEIFFFEFVFDPRKDIGKTRHSPAENKVVFPHQIFSPNLLGFYIGNIQLLCDVYEDIDFFTDLIH